MIDTGRRWCRLSAQPGLRQRDGVHPNDAGHLLIGQIILANLVGSLAE